MDADKFYKPLDGTIFGEGFSTPLDNKHALNNNVCVFGTSGTGKSYSFIEPNILQMNSNYVIADAKGDILHDLGNVLIQHGYKVSVLNLATEKYSMHYNPLAYVHTAQDIHHLATTIIPLDDDRHNAYWMRAGQQILETLIAFVCEALPKSERNMNSVTKLYSLIQEPITYLKNVIDEDDEGLNARLYRYLELLQKKHNDNDEKVPLIGQALFNYYNSIVPGSYPSKKWESVYGVEGDASRTLGNIVGTASPYMAQLEMPWVQRILASNDFDFANLLKPKQAFFVLYSDEDPSKSFLSNIFYTQLIKYLYAAARKTGTEKLPHRVRFFLDDFYNIHIPNFMNYLATARSRNISISIILQSEAQLREKYGSYAAASEIIGNCYSYLLTGTTDLDMAESAARRFNQNSSLDIRQASTETFFLDVSGHIYKLHRYNWKKHPVLKGMHYKPYLLKDHFKEPKKAEETPKPKKLYKLNDQFKNMLNANADNKAIQDLDPHFSLPRTDNPNTQTIFDSNAEINYFNFLTNFVNKLGCRVFPHISLNNLIYDLHLQFPQKIKNNMMSVDFCICTYDFRPVAAIEIDGNQHRTDKEQVINDIYKDSALYYAHIPVFRLKASYSTDYAKAADIFNETDKQKAKQKFKKLNHKSNIMAFCSAFKAIMKYKELSDLSELPHWYAPYNDLIFYKKSEMQSVFEPDGNNFVKILSLKQLDKINEFAQMEQITKKLNKVLANEYSKPISENPDEDSTLESNTRYHTRLAQNKTVDDVLDYFKPRYAGCMSRYNIIEDTYCEALAQAFNDTYKSSEFKPYFLIKPNKFGTNDVYSADGKTLYASNDSRNMDDWENWTFTSAFFKFLSSFDDWSKFKSFNGKIEKDYNDYLNDVHSQSSNAVDSDDLSTFDNSACQKTIADINKVQSHSNTFTKKANKRLANAEATLIGKKGTIGLREAALNDKTAEDEDPLVDENDKNGDDLLNESDEDKDVLDFDNPDDDVSDLNDVADLGDFTDEESKKRYAGGRLSRNDVKDARYLEVIRQAFGETVRNGAFTGYIQLRPNNVGTQDAYSSDGQTLYATNDNSNGLGWQSWHLTPAFFDFICKFKNWNSFSLFNTKVEQYYDIQKKNEEES